jgi:hypothetical protein
MEVKGRKKEDERSVILIERRMGSIDFVFGAH